VWRGDGERHFGFFCASFEMSRSSEVKKFLIQQKAHAILPVHVPAQTASYYYVDGGVGVGVGVGVNASVVCPSLGTTSYVPAVGNLYFSFLFWFIPSPTFSPISDSHGFSFSFLPQHPTALTGDEGDDDPDPEKRRSAVPLHGNMENFNINSLLFSNLIEAEYFRALTQLRSYNDILDEIYRSVSHVEPWQMGTSRIPSTAFCLLLKCLQTRLTFKQMKGMLDTNDNPLVRAIGFLYLRYATPPKDLWKWYEKYLEDEEEFCPSADKTMKMTMGSFCTKLLVDMAYFGTTLPRIPVPIERRMKVLLLLLQERQKRRRANYRLQDHGHFHPGAKIRAIYGDDENEPAWYDAVIDSKDTNVVNKYWVTFPEYGNSECVDLGDMEIPQSSGEASSSSSSYDNGDHRNGLYKSEMEDGKGGRGRERDYSGRQSRSRSRSTSRDHCRRGQYRDGSRRSRSRSRDRGQNRGNDYHGGRRDNLMEKVLQSSRDASTAIGKQYAQRPVSYKESLALKLDRHTVRQKSPSPARDRNEYQERRGGVVAGGAGGTGGTGGGVEKEREKEREREREREKAEHAERLKNLIGKYG